MRFRLGLLQDQAAINKQLAQEAAERNAKRHKHEKATAKTEAEIKAEEEAAVKAKDKPKEESKKESKRTLKIRPLSEAKAIDSGANLASEVFLLLVAIGCVVGERLYSSQKESTRKEDVAERLEELENYEKAVRHGMVEMEREIIRLRKKAGETPPRQYRILPKEVYELEEREEGDDKPQKGWFARIADYVSRTKDDEARQASTTEEAPQAEGENASKASTSPAPQPSSTILDKVLHPSIVIGASKNANEPLKQTTDALASPTRAASNVSNSKNTKT